MNGVGSLDRVESPQIAQAPETVSEDVTREAREKAERETKEARERAEKEKDEKAETEERASRERTETDERASEEQASGEEQASAGEAASGDQYAGDEQYGAGEEQYAAVDGRSGGDGESGGEVASAPTPASTALYLTVPKMGLSGDPVANSVDEGTLMNGAGKLPASGFPWQPGSNVYIASHVYGYEGTGSWQHFAALPSMTYGDEIILTDANGTEYRYAVSEILTVAPTDVWVTNPTGQDMVSLQTCVGPGWSERLVVRATRVS